MYYGVRDEEGKEKNTETLGIFLPFYHFERMMEKNIEIANGIGLGCREHILNEVKRQTGTVSYTHLDVYKRQQRQPRKDCC